MINFKKTEFKNDNDLLNAFMSREYNNIYFVTENVSTQNSMMFEFVPRWIFLYITRYYKFFFDCMSAIIFK